LGGMFYNLVWVTLGNAIAGAMFVAGAYRYASAPIDAAWSRRAKAWAMRFTASAGRRVNQLPWAAFVRGARRAPLQQGIGMSADFSPEQHEATDCIATSRSISSTKAL